MGVSGSHPSAPLTPPPCAPSRSAMAERVQRKGAHLLTHTHTHIRSAHHTTSLLCPPRRSPRANRPLFPTYCAAAAQDEAAREQRRSHQRRQSQAERQMKAARRAMVPTAQSGSSGHQRSTSLTAASAAASEAVASVRGDEPAAGAMPHAVVDHWSPPHRAMPTSGANRHNRSRSMMAGARTRSAATLLAPQSMGHAPGGNGEGGSGGYLARLHRVGSALPRPRQGARGEGAVVSRRAVRRRLLRAGASSENGSPVFPDGSSRSSSPLLSGAPAPVGSRTSKRGGPDEVRRVGAGTWDDGAEEDGVCFRPPGAQACGERRGVEWADDWRHLCGAAVAPALRATLQQFMRLMRIARKQRLLVPEETEAFVGAMRGALRPDGAQISM